MSTDNIRIRPGSTAEYENNPLHCLTAQFADRQVIHDFAYKGNVDVDAYFKDLHETANG